MRVRRSLTTEALHGLARVDGFGRVDPDESHRRSRCDQKSVTVDRPQAFRYRTYPWTATAADFQPIDGTVTLPPGATEGSVTVQVRGDTLVEGDEVFVVEFCGTRRLTNTRATAVVMIRDDSGG